MRRTVAGVLVAAGLVSLGVLIDLTASQSFAAGASHSTSWSTFVRRSVNSVACVRKKPNGVCVYQCDVTDHFTSAGPGDPDTFYRQGDEDSVNYCFRQRYPDGPPPSPEDPYDQAGSSCDVSCAPAVLSMCCEGLDASVCPG